MSHDALAATRRQPRRDRRSSCPSLRDKNVTPHVLRHTAAMRLLHAGVDTTVIALWLGHENVATTQIYLHADLALKQRALDRTTPPTSTPGRYRPPDQTPRLPRQPLNLMPTSPAQTPDRPDRPLDSA